MKTSISLSLKHALQLGIVVVISTPLAAADAASSFDYLDPPKVLPYDSAPRAKEHLLGSSEAQETYSLILYQGDEVFTAITEFAKRHQVGSAHFTAIGAVHDVKVGWLDLNRKQYKIIPVPGQVEILSLIGDVGVVAGSGPVVHAHLTCGLTTGEARGGHLVHAVTSPTVEVFITVHKTQLNKVPDSASGMTIFQ